MPFNREESTVEYLRCSSLRIFSSAVPSPAEAPVPLNRRIEAWSAAACVLSSRLPAWQAVDTVEMSTANIVVNTKREVEKPIGGHPSDRSGRDCTAAAACSGLLATEHT